MKGKLQLVISMVIFGTIGIFVKYIGLSSGLIASVRGIVGALFIIGVMLVTKKKPQFALVKKKIPILVASGTAIGFNWILLFEAYQHTGIPVATVCYYMAPIFVIAATPFIFKEKIKLRQLICVTVALMGIVAVSGVLQSDNSKLTGVLFGIGAATLYASVIVMNKFMGCVPAYEKTAVQLGVAGITVLPYALLTVGQITVNTRSILLLLVVGIVHTGFAYLLYFEAVKKLKNQTVAVLSYIDPASAIVLSSVIFMQVPTVYELIGVVLILGAALLSEIKTDKEDK